MQETPEQSGRFAAVARLRRFEGLAYALFAGALVLFVARLFYASLELQIFYSSVRGDPYLLARDWSAPLDDVFIHFDFARSAARGAPFEWSAGNGYSSGGTSLLYPFVLAPGYLLGFRGDRLMQFAAVVACTSVFATLLASRRLFRSLPVATTYLIPPLLLSIGALDWSLWSGMEVAFFLAVWSLAFIAWDDLVHGVPGFAEHGSPFRGALGLGLAGAVVVATRPEAVVVVAVLAIFAALAVRRRAGASSAIAVLCVSLLFPLGVVLAQALANRLLTGDWSAAGALVKLEMNDPRLTGREVLDAWIFHVRYQIARVTGHHLGGDGPGSLAWGSLLWCLAALSLVFPRTRRVGAVLWLQSVLWVLVVALNGQVRWQNERYTMPALAWMLLAAGIGVAALVTHDFGAGARARLWTWSTRLGAGLAILALGVRQLPQLRDQVWFFGRASRNIRDQHVKVGRMIRREVPAAHRILVGDAGAIPYASDLPALDIIGLGGFPGLPFARASRWGVAAAIELIERIPAADRPDLLAIYPGWWGDFPLWFGRPLDGVSVRGNVICGGLTKMIYAADWSVLGRGHLPTHSLRAGEVPIDELDFADVLSEQAHSYRIDGALGFVAMKLLAEPLAAAPSGAGPDARPPKVAPRRTSWPSSAIWDAGRVVPPGAVVSFVLRDLAPGRALRLVLRTAPTEPATLRFDVDGSPAGTISLRPSDVWTETALEVPRERVRAELSVKITVQGKEVVLHHLWGLQAEP